MGRRKFSEIIFKVPSELNKDERKVQFLASSFILLLFFYALSFVFVNFLMHLNYLPFFLALCPLILTNYIYTCYWDILNKKYVIQPVKSPFQLSYQGYVILFTLASPMFFFLMLALGLTSGNLWFGLGGAIALVYPIIVMFLRIKTFSDDSINVHKEIKSKKEAMPEIAHMFSDDEEMEVEIKSFGYMPISYWLISASLGLFTVGAGFSGIQLHFTKGSPSLEAALFMIIIGFLIQSVYLFPDKLNKIVPIDLKTKNGFWFMLVLAFVLFGVSQWLIGIVTALSL